MQDAADDPRGAPSMTSDDRYAARRARRDAKRARNRSRRIEGCTLEAVADLDNLYEAARGAAGGVRWKSTVQRYMARVMRNTTKARSDLLEGRDIRRGFVTFDIRERGKLRHISSVHFSERVVQKSLSRHVLAPAIWPTLAEGCSANIKGKGTDYAIARLKAQLVRHYRRHGAEGYVLQVDFSDYFGNIDHGAAKRLVDRAVDDAKVLRLIYDQIDSSGEIGLGLGSEPNQILAAALPSPIDHLGLRMPGILASGRYMDDSYFVALDKDTLWCLLALIEIECAKLGIVINGKKTKAVKLSRGFTFLKKRFFFGRNGKVVVRPCRESISRQRRKLKRQAALVKAGVMTREQAVQSYQSWRGMVMHLDAHETMLRMDDLFRELFS